jgi:hypothetical protein
MKTMPIIAKAGGESNFEPAPAGTWAAVCVDVIDLGQQPVEYKGQEKLQHKVRIAWQLTEDAGLTEDHQPMLAMRRYTLSLDERAALRKDLETWRGRKFTAQELNGWDIEAVIGVPCLLSISHTQRDGKTFANVDAVLRLPNGMPAPAPTGYIRKCEREPRVGQ